MPCTYHVMAFALAYSVLPILARELNYIPRITCNSNAALSATPMHLAKPGLELQVN